MEDKQMDKILEDFSGSSLAAAIETNLFELFRYWGNSTKSEFHDSPDVTWFITGVLDPFMNGVFRTQLTPDNVDETIEKTLAHFSARQVPFIWWMGSATQPADLEKYLETYGLIDTGGTPGMAVDLLALKKNLPTPSSLIIKPVEDAETLKHWVQTLIVGFNVSETSEDICFDLFANLGFDLPLRNYVGLLDGKAVAVSSLFLGVGVAGIYCVTTIPEVRRQGIGAAVTLAPLRDARAMGYRIGVLQSSDMGFGVYRKLEFREYCTLRSRVWKGETNQ